METGRVSPGLGTELEVSRADNLSPGPVLAGISFNDTVKGAASLTARVALYPSLLYNLARSQLQDNWHWFDKVTESVILGALPFGSMLDTFQDKGIKAVVTLNEEFEVFISTRQYQEIGIDHLHIPTVDYLYAPPVEDLHRGVAFIAEHAERRELTYVHCKAGRGRSTTLVICYLVRQMRMSPEEAYAFVRTKRPQVCLAEGQWAAVREFHKSCLEARAADPEAWPDCTDELVKAEAPEQSASELVDISGRGSPAGHARSGSASESSGASETCAAALPVDPWPGIPRVDSPNCVSSHPAQPGSQGSPERTEPAAAPLPEPMLITVEAGPSEGRIGEVPVMRMAHQQGGGQDISCSHQDVDIVDVRSGIQHGIQHGMEGGSLGQLGQEHGIDLQPGSLQQTEQGHAVADRLRAAVFSRGFEPCPGSEQAASSTEEEAADRICCDSADCGSACRGPRAMVLCSQEADAGTTGRQSQCAEPLSRTHERPAASGKLCQRDLHDIDREAAEQTASKKRRSELSCFSISANLSCDDLSRAGTEPEGMTDEQLHSRGATTGEHGCEGMELEREDSRFHEWATIDRNGSVVSLGR